MFYALLEVANKYVDNLNFRMFVYHIFNTQLMMIDFKM